MSRKRTRNRSKAEMNVVPYIDVMLVLLVIFMISAPLINQSVEVAVPESNNATDIAPSQGNNGVPEAPIVISIDRKGLYYHSHAEDENKALQINELAALTQSALTKHPKADVFLRADKVIVYGHVMKVMDLLSGAGVKNVGLISNQAGEGDE